MVKISGNVGKTIKNMFSSKPKLIPDLKSIKKVPKTDADLKEHISTIKKKSFARRLMTSKIFIGSAATGITAITLSSVFIDNYIKGKTGCFLESKDNVCKILDLSCCNREESTYIPKCSDEIIKRLKVDRTSCANYDFINAKNCCEKCNCIDHSCEPDEKMSCHRATAAEAISYFAENINTSVSNMIYDLLSSSIVIKYVIISFFVLIIGLIVYKFI